MSIIKKSPISEYLVAIKKYPVLSREEERELAIRYKEEGDIDAAKRLVLSNMRFVIKIALEYKDFGLDLAELIQEGTLGLMMAVKKYDPYKGYKLISYAVWWIRAYIHNYIMANFRIVKMGTRLVDRKLFPHIKEISSSGEEITKELAERFGVAEKDILEMEMRIANKDFSIDYELFEEGRVKLSDFIKDDSPTPEEEVMRDEEAQIIKKKIEEAKKKLAPVEKFVIERRVLSENPMTLKEIGNELHLSKERVRQIEKKALDKIKVSIQHFKRV